MKVIKKTGLVPVKFLVGALPYKTGEVAGLTPERARKAHDEGVVQLVPIDDEIETYEDADPKPRTPEAEQQPVEEVEIPSNWDDPSFHPLKLVKLAKMIAGVEVKDAAEAKDIVTKEVERRTSPDAA